MRILVVSDIHYALRQYDWVLSVAQGFDAVILAGDLLEISSMVDRAAQIVVVRTYLEELSKITRVLVCSGNHDLDGEDAAGEQTAIWMKALDQLGVVADQSSVEIGDVLITVCGWWDGTASREAIGTQLAEAALRPKAKWVWVYHAPPSNSPVSWGGKRHFGDDALTEWIETYRPDIVVSGHVHTSPFIPGGSWADRMGTSWVFNPGQQIGPVPTHIVLDLDRGEAGWLSIYGQGSVDLGQAPEAGVITRDDLPLYLRA